MAKTNIELIREAAESDLIVFIKLVAPYMHLGSIHEELASWATSSKHKKNKLILLPRGHLKSRMVAYLAAWWITKNPAETLLYVSSTSALAELQLHSIKGIFESKVYRRYWPDMIHEDEGKREKWNASEIIVDHPTRAAEGTRDPTIKAVGITGGTTGFHATKVILDDLVDPRNAYTNEGREKVAMLYSQLASIEEPDAEEVIVGTRYHPNDLYNTVINMTETIYNEDEEEIEEKVYDVFERVVEIDGEFLWPRSNRRDGKPFGFDQATLARIKAKYQNISHYTAQYYNDPNKSENGVLTQSNFQYYDKKFLTSENDVWYFNGNKLALSAAMDFAFSTGRRADSTAIVVVGIDSTSNIYVLDILRFKTDRISEYFKNMLGMYGKWSVRRWRCEVTIAQQAIVRELKEQYIRPQGLPITIDEYRPSRNEGDKAERIEAVLGHRYENRTIWHYKGGNTQLLEEELVLRNPPHDDIKDSLSNAVAIAKAPSAMVHSNTVNTNVVKFSRFGGI